MRKILSGACAAAAAAAIAGCGGSSGGDSAAKSPSSAAGTTTTTSAPAAPSSSATAPSITSSAPRSSTATKKPAADTPPPLDKISDPDGDVNGNTGAAGVDETKGINWTVTYMNAHCRTPKACQAGYKTAQRKLDAAYGKTVGAEIYRAALPMLNLAARRSLTSLLQSASNAVAACAEKYPDGGSAYDKCLDAIP